MPTSPTRAEPPSTGVQRTGGGGAALVAAFGARLVSFVASLAGVLALVLVLLVMAPGDPIDLLPNAEEVRPLLEERWHLDRSVPERLVLYAAQVVTGDLGVSLAYRPGTPVTEVIGAPALRSLGRILAALGLTLAWGAGLAWFTAGQRRSIPRRAVQMVSIAPVFLAAHVLVYTLNEAAFAAMNAGMIDRPHWFALPDEPSVLRALLAVTVLGVASGALAEVHGEVEDALVRIRTSGFIDAARARGEPEWPHVLRNLLPPLATVSANRMAFFVGGAVILERVLLLNGAGSILWQAALLRDYELALGVSLAAGALVCTTRLLAEAIRIAVDPRLREGTWLA